MNDYSSALWDHNHHYDVLEEEKMVITVVCNLALGPAN